MCTILITMSTAVRHANDKAECAPLRECTGGSCSILLSIYVFSVSDSQEGGRKVGDRQIASPPGSRLAILIIGDHRDIEVVSGAIRCGPTASWKMVFQAFP